MAAPINPGALAGFGQAAGGVGGLIGGTNQSTGSGFLSPTQAPFLQDLFRRAQEFSQQGTFQGFDPLQSLGQQGALQFAGGLSPFISQAQEGVQGLIGQGLNPFLEQTAQSAARPILESLTQSILPSIRGEAAATGNIGSSRQGIAEGLASGQASKAIAEQTGDIFSRGFGQALQARQAGLQLAPQIAQLGFLPSQIQQQIGAQRRGLSQERQLDPFTQLQRLQSLLGAPILESTSESSGGTGVAGLFGEGGLLSGGGGLGNLGLVNPITGAAGLIGKLF